jgi:hypothetical protein
VELLPGRTVMSHAETLAGACKTQPARSNTRLGSVPE